MASNKSLRSATSKRHHSTARKDASGSFPWTSKQSQNSIFLNPREIYETEYAACYKAWSTPKIRKPIKPANKRVGGQPFEGTTSYKQVYVKHPVKKREEKAKEEYVKPKGVIDNRTIYKRDYTAYSEKEVKNCRVKSCKPVHTYTESSSKFKGSSIYKSSYQPYDPDLAEKSRSKPVKPIENLHTSCKGEGDTGNSTFKEDFKPIQGVKPPEPILPTENNIKNEGSFDDSTIYKKAFVPHPSEPVIIAKAPIKSPSQTNIPFVAITTHMSDYVDHGKVIRQPCCRPTENSLMSDLKFQGETTHGLTYKAWPTPEKFVPPWGNERERKITSGKFFSITTYSEDFRGYGKIEMTQAYRPKPNKDPLINQKGRFSKDQLKTTYDASFPPWPDAKPATFCEKQDKIYHEPEEKMETTTIHKSHFKGEQTEKAQLCKNPSEHRQLNVERKDMVFTTTYKDTYKAHEITIPSRPKPASQTLRVV